MHKNNAWQGVLKQAFKALSECKGMCENMIYIRNPGNI